MTDVHISIVAALGTITAAGVAAWQGWLQKQSLHHSLFDRRYRVFEAIMTFLAAAAKNANVAFEDAMQLKRETRQAEFLFGPEVEAFIDRVFKKGLELRAKNAVLENEQDHTRRAELLDEIKPLEDWLLETAFEEARDTFRPYLKLHAGDWENDLLR